ncbi:MAG: hypothetical protein PVS3B2_08940 [Candidatus Dormibacteraceae bacterium]
MTLLGWIGVWLLVAGAVAIVVEVVLAVVWGMAVAKHSRALQERIETERVEIEADLKRLKDALDEMRRLWKPYRRVLRLLNHPLAIALFQSYAARRAR